MEKVRKFPEKINLDKIQYTPEKNTYVPIHVHSSFSLFDSVSSTKEIVEVASSMGMPGCSITDHGMMSGCYSFVSHCKEKKINPIVGCEFYVNEKRNPEEKNTKNQHLVLLAMNYEGYKNLLKILYDALVNGFYYRGRTDLDFIAENSKGLICTTACAASPIIQPMLNGKKEKATNNFKKLLEIFGDRLYLEYQFNEMDEQKVANDFLLSLERKHNVKSVYGLDSHYTYPRDVYVHDILKMNMKKVTLKTSDWQNAVFNARRLFIKPYSIALKEPFMFGYTSFNRKKIESLLEATKEISSRVSFDMNFKLSPPQFIWKGEKVNSVEFLKMILNKYFAEKYEIGDIPKDKRKEYWDRMWYEYNCIAECGYCDYFLIVWDMVRNAAKKGIFKGIGRGSASGCLVSYILGINGVDPLQHGLLFERFMDVKRKDPPDIDLDWEHEKGEEIEKYLKEKYGEDKVAHVCTFSWWGTKSAFGEVFKTLGYSVEEVEGIKRFIRLDEGDNRDEKTVKEAIEYVKKECTNQHFLDIIDREQNRGLNIVTRLIGNVKNVGKHPGGSIMSPEPIYNYIPVIRHNNEIITGFSQGSDGRTELEYLVKLDNLKVKAVTVVKDCLAFIKKRHGLDLTRKLWHLNLEIKEIYSYYQSNLTDGVFQVESDEINSFIRRLKPNCFEDLRAIVALFRPGPLMSGEASKFIESKHGRKEIVYIHPILEKYIGYTHGCFLYQEQLMNIMMDLAGFNKTEVMQCMKIMKKSYDVNDKRIVEFSKRQEGALVDISKFTKEQAHELTETMRNCYAYTFNKSHSTAYALFSYQMMWLKYNYPTEFYTALLSNTENKETEHKGGKTILNIKRYIDGARKLGISFLPPHVSGSGSRFRIEGDKLIRCGTAMIVGIGKSGFELEKIEYDEDFDFIEFLKSTNINWGKLNKSKIEKLIKIGYFDGTLKRYKKVNRKQFVLAWQGYAAQKNKKKKTFEDCLKEVIEKVDSDYSKLEIINFEIQTMRFPLSMHPLELDKVKNNVRIWNEKQEKKKMMIRKVFDFEKDDLKNGIMIGLVTDVKIAKVKKGMSQGEKLAIVDFEDTLDKVKILVWPSYYSIEKYQKYLEKGKILIIKVKRMTKNADENKSFELSPETNKSHMIDIDDLERMNNEK